MEVQVFDTIGYGPAQEQAGAGGHVRGRCAAVALDALLEADSPRLGGQDEEHVRLLAARGDTPPILVDRRTMRVVDGMHRLRAARLRGDESIEAEFLDGGAEELFALAVKLNLENGLPLSQADRMAATVRVLRAWPEWSDGRIAVQVGLSATTVSVIRRRSAVPGGQSDVRVGRDGRVRSVRAAYEGRLRASRLIATDPGASLRTIADRAGIATSTAKDVRDRILKGEDPLPPKAQAARARAAEARAARAHASGEPGPAPHGPAPHGPGLRAAPAGERVREAAGRGFGALPAAAGGPVLSEMRKDPSMRSEAGRMLLQLLAAHPIGDEATWRRLALAVPAHRAAALARAARRCADHWLRFAEELEAKSW
ncbi:ParB/RepB/Spo0J family partition protein (plasmid) [Streptomyces sp. NBC_00335]|uniref:ParB/RepB/Spo0J family partition protein n=1 Tax=unclassified Streptomyces TaxID=2593676 RepID=UPI002257127A|nr:MULTISPECIES: ParB/RepB/Spo0J family partition protein [unclassified Streptomyces]MCX5410012.1 ParB/RepB/Spo0J family partition protein [Streptomyces sp. NBC_00086]